MPDLLFVYGTLRDPDLLAAVLARPVEAASLAAAAPGFQTVHYPRRAYPALVRRPGGRVPGLLLTNISRFEFDLLDAYEGPEYRRSNIAVVVDEELHEAHAYLPAIDIPRDAGEWSFETWQALHKPKILPAEQALAEQLRIKLVAVRPH